MTLHPTYIWDIGTGYDLFISLEVLYDPDRYGLRGNWAAGVRSRLPVKKREFLQRVLKQVRVWPLPWLAQLPLPHKDAAAVLQVLTDLPPERRLTDLVGCYLAEAPRAVLYDVAARGQWTAVDQTTLLDIYREMYRKENKKRKISEEDVAAQLDAWADPVTFGTQYLAALQTYYEVFFHEDEARISPSLVETQIQAQELLHTLPLPQLLEELSQGLRFEATEVQKVQTLRLIPSFWTTPLSLFMCLPGTESEWMFFFGGRPVTTSLVPGEVVPEFLYQTLKALADPTRLRILRYLSTEPLAPAELARRLRLRPPTVIHHLDALRLARLVYVTLGQEGRRYAARREAVKYACAMLEAYLDHG